MKRVFRIVIIVITLLCFNLGYDLGKSLWNNFETKVEVTI